MKIYRSLIIAVCMLQGALSYGAEAGVVAGLVKNQGSKYVKMRDDVLLDEKSELKAITPKGKTVKAIIDSRRSSPHLFREVGSAIESHSERMRKGTFDSDGAKGRAVLKLSNDLSALRRKDKTLLNVAMLEVYWKLESDYDLEQISALRILCLNSEPVPGAYDAARDVIRRTESILLGKETLDLIHQYIFAYDQGDALALLADVDYAARRFEEDLAFQEHCLKLLSDIKNDSASKCISTIRSRIKLLKEMPSTGTNLDADKVGEIRIEADL